MKKKNMNWTFSKRNRGDYHCVGIGASKILGRELGLELELGEVISPKSK